MDTIMIFTTQQGEVLCEQFYVSFLQSAIYHFKK